MAYCPHAFPTASRARPTAYFVAVLAGLAVGPLASAQQLPSGTEAIDPARLRERFGADPAPSPPAPTERTDTRAGVLPESLQGLRVMLRSVRIEATTVLPDDAAQKLADSYTGREVTGAEISDLAARLTAMYRNAGYILSLVVLPAQFLSDGTLTLRVVEGYVERVTVQAGAGVTPELVDRLVAIGGKIRASRPVQGGVLERYLLIANEFPGIELRSVLTPSQTPGAADLTLIAAVRKTEGFASLDNYGSRYLGPVQASFGLTGNQLLGINDQWRVVGVGSGNSDMAFAQFSYSQLIGSEGLKAGIALSSARTRPGDVLRPLDVRGNADTVSLSASYPLLKTRNQSVTARATYDHIDVRTDILGTRVIEDRVRALRLGVSWRALDALDGQNVLDVDFSQGLGGMQASDLLKSRVGAQGVFSKLAFDYERTQFIGGSNASVSFGLAGQWAGTPLLSSEQYALGGRRFGRAYEPAELVGEKALAVRIEPRYTGALEAPGVRSYQVFGLYDLGRVWKVGSVSPGTPDSPSLASAGLGARLFMAGNVVATVEAVWPLTKPLASSPGRGKDARVLASLLVRF
ncbi:MAG: ShlB/FhaC/HecB family hemolysin secretion/activation protein [Polaromonas sp.]|nr:ShlB/FhaC/HecB family hemolysin secretion/activation protein [Polaromonas sp.]